MGIADFGVTPNRVAYAWSSDSVVGRATFLRDLAVDNVSLGPVESWCGFQLNLVLVFDIGAQQYTYWVQDVAPYNTSNHRILFLDNIWNLTAWHAQMQNSTVSGNGGLHPSPLGLFYADIADPLLIGVGATVRAPSHFDLELDTGLTTGPTFPYVIFSFDDGYGFTIYDLVSFPFATGVTTFYGFVVYGFDYTPVGIPYDAEFVMGGPGRGANTTDVASELELQLGYWNGHNYQVPTNAYNFGGETAEGSDNVETFVGVNPSNGNLSAVLINGTAQNAAPAVLYDQTQVSILNISDPGAEGALLLNGSPTYFMGGAANVTLAPGIYNVSLAVNGVVTPLGQCTLHAGEYEAVSPSSPCVQPLAVSVFAVSSSSVQQGTSVTFTVSATNGKPPYTYSYAGLPPGCTSQNTATLTCTPTAAGDYRITVTVTDSVGNTAKKSVALHVTALPVSVSSFSVSQSSLSVGQSVTFQATATGGTPPYTYSYAGLPPGCTSQNTATLTCTPTAAGDYTITVTVTDASSMTASRLVTLTVQVASGPAGASSPFGSPLFFGLLAVILAGVVGTLVFVALRRRRLSLGPAPPSPPPVTQRETEPSTSGGSTAFPKAYSGAPSSSIPYSAIAPPPSAPRQTETAFCYHCGSPVVLGASFCNRCGGSLKAPPASPPTTVFEGPAANPPSVYQAPPENLPGPAHGPIPTAAPAAPRTRQNYCLKCGAPLPPESAFCGACGTRLG